MTELLVCVKCRRGQELPEDERRPGQRLFDTLAGSLPEGVTLTPTECMSNCDNGCTVALRAPGKWTFIYGNLHEAEDGDTIRDGLAKYHATEDGLVPWRERPEHFKRNCIARMPPLEAPND